MTRQDLIRRLQAHRSLLVRERSDHSLWENPANGRRSAVLRHRRIPNSTAQAI